MRERVSLEKLVNRIKHDEELLKRYPQCESLIKGRIARTRGYIVDCVLQNANSPFLKRILMEKEVKGLDDGVAVSLTNDSNAICRLDGRVSPIDWNGGTDYGYFHETQES